MQLVVQHVDVWSFHGLKLKLVVNFPGSGMGNASCVAFAMNLLSLTIFYKFMNKLSFTCSTLFRTIIYDTDET